jgi:signal transduction histidine kinase
MPPRPDPAGLTRHPLRSRATVRGRLAALYGGVFLASGAALLAIIYVLVDNDGSASSDPDFQAAPGPQGGSSQPVMQQHSLDLHALLVGSDIALATMTVVSVAAGWLLAGRVLRPLRTMTTMARQISEDDLHRRLALPGPRDELKDLGDTIDGLLARLEAAFGAQRNFVANASHELRTPLTVSRATLQVALSDPDLTLDTLRTACEEAIETGRQQEQLIEALLTLARSQRGLEHPERVDLAAIVTEVTRAHEADAADRGLQLRTRAEPAIVLGDAPLLARLSANLVENALRYNVHDGNVQIAVRKQGETALLTVTNTGPVVPPDEVSRLLQPFQRASNGRTGTHDGLGIGLSIVKAIATAHGAVLTLYPKKTGGLDIEIVFRPVQPQADRTPIGMGSTRKRMRVADLWQARYVQDGRRH